MNLLHRWPAQHTRLLYLSFNLCCWISLGFSGPKIWLFWLFSDAEGNVRSPEKRSNIRIWDQSTCLSYTIGKRPLSDRDLGALDNILLLTCSNTRQKALFGCSIWWSRHSQLPRLLFSGTLFGACRKWKWLFAPSPWSLETSLDQLCVWHFLGWWSFCPTCRWGHLQ